MIVLEIDLYDCIITPVFLQIAELLLFLLSFSYNMQIVTRASYKPNFTDIHLILWK